MIPLVAAGVTALGIFLVLWSLGRRNTEFNSLDARLKIYEAIADEREIELRTTSFVDRIVVPTINRLSIYLAARTPERQRQALRERLELAGRPFGLAPEHFLAVRIAAAIAAFVVGLLLGLLLRNVMIEVLGAAAGAGFGYYFPILWLNQKVGGRRKDIERGLPDCLDLLTISVEAGLGFDQAVQRVVDKFHNTLSNELAQVQLETQLGRPRLEALDAMGRRAGVADLHNFVQAIIQSEQMGVGIGRILRIQADEIRRRRRQRAQEKAAQATLKMLLPMVGCIFPTLWIVLLGPAILILMHANGSG